MGTVIVSSGCQQILHMLRKRGFRITKQRELILDIIFENECTSCKEIYYRAIQEDPGIGMATVYRMVNMLTDMGILKVTPFSQQLSISGSGKGCQILLKNHQQIDFDQSEWLGILQEALQRRGYSADEEIIRVTIQ